MASPDRIAKHPPREAPLTVAAFEQFDKGLQRFLTRRLQSAENSPWKIHALFPHRLLTTLRRVVADGET